MKSNEWRPGHVLVNEFEADQAIITLPLGVLKAKAISLGAYSYVPVGAITAPIRLAEPVADTLFFAGEATNSDGHSGTVHGAIATGYRAADELLGCRPASSSLRPPSGHFIDRLHQGAQSEENQKEINQTADEGKIDGDEDWYQTRQQDDTGCRVLAVLAGKQ
jgi:hypothetical protein